MHCSLNNNRIPPKTRENKKKNEKNENAPLQNADAA